MSAATNPNPALEGFTMSTATLDLDAMLAEMQANVVAPTLTPEEHKQRKASQARSAATCRNRQQRKSNHDALLAQVSGDKEKLKTIQVWVPRQTKGRLFARAFNRIEFAQGGEKFTDLEAEFETTEYDLTEIEVERAKPPKEEIEFAKLQGRFQTPQKSIQGFFAPKEVVRYASRPEGLYAPLGDFAWADRDDAAKQRHQEVQRIRKQAKPIRNLTESKA